MSSADGLDVDAVVVSVVPCECYGKDLAAVATFGAVASVVGLDKVKVDNVSVAPSDYACAANDVDWSGVAWATDDVECLPTENREVEVHC